MKECSLVISLENNNWWWYHTRRWRCSTSFII